MIDTENELKPCPFCGKPAHLWKTSMETYIECSDYHPRKHRVCISEKTDEEAAKKWNERKGEQGDG